MILDKKTLEEMAEKHQARADKAYSNYQATGIQRYDRDYRINEDLADALRMAAAAEEDHSKLAVLKSELVGLAYRADELAYKGELTGNGKAFAESLIGLASAIGGYKRIERMKD